MKKWKIHFIPQTHWDKEWYFTKSISDVFLIDNIDKIYNIFKKNETKFVKYTYDGQYSIVDDYLKYYPENKYKIKELIQSNKLILGPWYTQTDMFNVMGESIVRNLLIGTKSVEKLNGQPLKVGYVPDSFGFNANLPQILKKSNLKAFVFWRGISGNQLEKGVANNWTGIDGTSILSYNMFGGGYGAGVHPLFDFFNHDWEMDDITELAKVYLRESKKEVLPYLEKMSKNTNGIILVPFGSDQIPVFDKYKELTMELNKIDNNHEWVLSDYDAFIEDVFNQTEKKGFGEINHELRFGQFSRAHKTITSSRYDIKLLGKKLEYLIYNVTEPLAIIYEKAGGQYPTNVIELSQKKLLESQAHDSAGACNTDETNRSIVERLSSGIDALESLNTLMTRRIIEPYNVEKNDLIIFNLNLYSTKIKKEITIFTKKPSFKIMDEKGLVINFTIKNQKYSAGEIGNFEMNTNTQFKNSNFKLDDEVGFYWTTIDIETNAIHPLSFGLFKIQECDEKLNIDFNKFKDIIENDYFKIHCDVNTGFISLLNKKTNTFIKEAFVLSSQFDAGDSYDFSPSKNNPQYTNQFRNVELMNYESNNEKVLWLNYSFKVPTELDAKQYIHQPVEMKIFLKNKDIKFEININNEVKDIKWMLNCKTGIKAKTSFADTAFGIIERPVAIPEMKIWQEQKWVDCPIEIEAMESVCWLQNDTNSYALNVEGNNEYQILDKEIISLTLFRGYSYIGRNDLIYRVGRASGVSDYPYETPESNLNKPLKIKVNVIIDNLENLVKISKENNIPACYYQKQSLQSYHFKGDNFLLFKQGFKKVAHSTTDLEISDNLVVSAFKKSYDESGYILRMYNPSNNVVNFIPLEGWIETDLMENEITQAQNTFKPNEVRTFWIKEV